MAKSKTLEIRPNSLNLSHRLLVCREFQESLFVT
jgi:hypothetical protein